MRRHTPEEEDHIGDIVNRFGWSAGVFRWSKRRSSLRDWPVRVVESTTWTPAVVTGATVLKVHITK